MGFKAQSFIDAKFSARVEDIELPDLKDWFEENEKPVWKVRGLLGQELGRANAAAEQSKNIGAILDGIASRVPKEQTDAIRKITGLGGETPADIIKRMEILVIGSVDPECSWDLAVKLCERFPIEFYQLTNKILQLTGQGHVPGKPKASGS